MCVCVCGGGGIISGGCYVSFLVSVLPLHASITGGGGGEG